MTQSFDKVWGENSPYIEIGSLLNDVQSKSARIIVYQLSEEWRAIVYKYRIWSIIIDSIRNQTSGDTNHGKIKLPSWSTLDVPSVPKCA